MTFSQLDLCPLSHFDASKSHYAMRVAKMLDHSGHSASSPSVHMAQPMDGVSWTLLQTVLPLKIKYWAMEMKRKGFLAKTWFIRCWRQLTITIHTKAVFYAQYRKSMTIWVWRDTCTGERSCRWSAESMSKCFSEWLRNILSLWQETTNPRCQ